jgi:hypothetical protein
MGLTIYKIMLTNVTLDRVDKCHSIIPSLHSGSIGGGHPCGVKSKSGPPGPSSLLTN